MTYAFWCCTSFRFGRDLFRCSTLKVIYNRITVYQFLYYILSQKLWIFYKTVWKTNENDDTNEWRFYYSLGTLPTTVVYLNCLFRMPCDHNIIVLLKFILVYKKVLRHVVQEKLTQYRGINDTKKIMLLFHVVSCTLIINIYFYFKITL